MEKDEKGILDFLDDVDEDKKKLLERHAGLAVDGQLLALQLSFNILKRAVAGDEFKHSIAKELETWYGEDADPEKSKDVKFRDLIRLYEVVAKTESDFLANIFETIHARKKESPGGERELNPAPETDDNGKRSHTKEDIQNAHNVVSFLDAIKKSEFTPEEIAEALMSKKENAQNGS